jgi:aspartyl-tRNA(Asn)/glutamyl-tRNA(Gln) amidotransferase subunit B
VRAGLSELPAARRARYRDVLGLTPYDAAVLVADLDAAGLFEATLAAVPALEPKPVANWVTGEYLRLRNAAQGPVEISAVEFGSIVEAVASGSISRAHGREVLEEHAGSGNGATAIIAARGFRQISDAGSLGTVVDAAIASNPGAVADYHAGKAQAIGFLVGQVMKATRGQANASLVQAAVRERLDAGSEEEG